MNLNQYKRLLIYGGSFDPPHVAHIMLPQLAREAIGAEAVAYVPCASQPLKQDVTQTPAKHRLAMLRLAVAEQPNAIVLTDEIDRASNEIPSYTVDTLKGIRSRFAGNLRLLIGTDQLAQFDKWHQYEQIIELAEPAVLIRPPGTADGVLDHLPDGFNKQEWVSRLVVAPQLDISSTQMRQRISAGKSIDGWSAPRVIKYIRRHGLYL